MPLQIRRGTEAERTAMAVPLAPGEPLYVTDDKRLFIGDGTTPGGVQITGFTSEDAVDAAGNALLIGQHQNITFIYGQTQDVANRIDAVIDLSVYSGEISADSFRGSIFAENSTLIIDSVTASINLDGTIKGNLIPDQNETYDIGSATNRFKDLYLSGSSLWLGNAQLTATGTVIDLPVGSTIGGQLLSGGDILITGDLNANVIGDDSSIIVDASTNTINANIGNFNNISGNLIGDVIGSVFGDDSTVLVDGISSSLRTNNMEFRNNEIISDTDEIYFRSHVFITDKSLNLTTTESLNQGSIEIENYESIGVGGFISLGSARGDILNRQKLENGDGIYSLAFLSLSGGNNTATAAFIAASVDGVTTDTIAPGSLDFNVSDDQGNFLSALDIRSTGLTRIKKGLSTNSGQDLGDTDTVDLTTVSTYFTTVTAETATLAVGSEGQIKTFAAVNVSAGNMVITVTNPAWGGSGTMTFSTNASGCTLQYIDSKWFCVGNNGVVFS